jgi:hypothetical protein
LGWVKDDAAYIADKVAVFPTATSQPAMATSN